eukprot:CAMPEP_0197021750 /NCGR_PEP_ID=MMETSP1384-20130603/2685_1 /TAXON_ID=29189 /ORGANISM="Ammonia sp." /LENGTH=538 /DNA_ID=CAMNT_0042449655 /DNA_START=39 /DNA_END=1655 /DNA_ORIENTATION=+
MKDIESGAIITDQASEPERAGTHVTDQRARSISSRVRPNSDIGSKHTHRHHPRKKSFDTSDILWSLPEIETRYFHATTWKDENGNVFRGECPEQMKPEEKQEETAQDTNTPKSKKKKKKSSRTKKIVFLEVKIKRISDIDTTSETFRCRFHYYLTWLASQEEFNLFEIDREHYSPDWVPKIELTNAAEIHQHYQGGNFTIKTNKSVGFANEWRIDQHHLGFHAWEGVWNRVRYEADVTFAEELELEAFPFDCQDLSLYMKVEKDSLDSCDIVPFPREGDFCLLDPQFSVLSEWYLENLVTEFGYTDPLKSKSLRCYSLVSIRIKASRRWRAHVGMIIVTFCMFSLGLGTFAQSVSPEYLGDRLGFCVTFLLADVATLQLMFVNLPNIPYWTILDFYIYSSFLYLFSITIWSCLAGANWPEEEEVDYIAFWVFLAIYVILHITYISFSIYYRIREKSKLNMTASELISYFKGQMESVSDRRAISNTWDQTAVFGGVHSNKDKGSPKLDARGRCNGDVTTFHFQGAKLQPLQVGTQMFHE